MVWKTIHWIELLICDDMRFVYEWDSWWFCCLGCAFIPIRLRIQIKWSIWNSCDSQIFFFSFSFIALLDRLVNFKIIRIFNTPRVEMMKCFNFCVFMNVVFFFFCWTEFWLMIVLILFTSSYFISIRLRVFYWPATSQMVIRCKKISN